MLNSMSILRSKPKDKGSVTAEPGEGHRRTKVIPRFPTERSCLALLYASLVTASKRWHGVQMKPAVMKQLQQVRAEIATSSGAQEAVA